ncbi:MAG: biotin/lipoyl-binding protein [Hyphomicrobiaceae bacterium]|nr:biotin/lipoyl-binding protein [Hyphomicrobiaceae bacterium]
MRTSEFLLRQVRRALSVAFLLGGVAVLLQAAAPLYLLYVIDVAIPARNSDAILLVTVLAAAALATQACLDAVRARVLLRAGLWAEHTLGSELLRPAGSASAAQADDLAALARLRRSASDGSLLAGLDAPWQILMIGVIALIDWRLAAIAGVAAVVVLAHGFLALRGVDEAEAAATHAQERALVFSRALGRPAAEPADRASASLADRWERINREHVANAYTLAAKAVAVADLARFVRAAAQIAALALGAWLAVEGSLTVGGLVAALLLLWRVLGPMERLVDALPSLAPARSAWLRLSALPVAPAASAGGELPMLRLYGPLSAGFAAVLALLAVGSAVLVHTELRDIVGLPTRLFSASDLTRIVAPRSGTSAQVFVKEGALVSKGDLIATLDTRALDGRLASLRLQAATAGIELDALRQQHAAAPPSGAGRSRAPLDKLESRMAEVDRRSRDLLAEIAAAEAEVALSRIAAPGAGRIVALEVRPGMPVEAAAPLATLLPADAAWLDRLFATVRTTSLSDRIRAFLGTGSALAQGTENP